ncbi:MAG: SRPBCC family protein, partial [Pseudomonadota bacterium]
MKITKKIRIEADTDRVWQVLGPDYAHADRWASSVFVSHPRPGAPKIAGAPCVGRVCHTSLGPFTETIEAYDPERRRVAYAATGEKMPGFVRSLVNSWYLSPIGDHATEARMELNADITPPFNWLMGWIMHRQFNRVLSESIEELKHFA